MNDYILWIGIIFILLLTRFLINKYFLEYFDIKKTDSLKTLVKKLKKKAK